MSLSTVQFRLKDFKFSLQEIKDLVGLPEWKILNIYMYGSRVYGTFNYDSDYDFLVIDNSLDRDREIKHGKYNIHIHTPDKFQDDLWKYQMVNLECVFAPSFARIQETIEYKKAFGFEPIKFKKSIFKQSHNSWMKSKMKFREMDIERATKSLFHSMRILMFGIQVISENSIFDFSEANYYWQEISDIDEYKWNFFKEKFLPRKKDMEEILMKMEPKNV